MKKLILSMLAASMLSVPALASVKPVQPKPLVATQQANLAEGRIGRAEMDASALFSANAPRLIEITVDGIGKLVFSAGPAEAVDPDGKVMRRDASSSDGGKAVFVKGLSGHVSGWIDTPRGQLLLGYANGEYFAYKEAHGGSPSDANRPAALKEAQLAKGSAAYQTKPAEVAYPMEFNAAELSGLPEGAQVSLALPGAGTFDVVHDATEAGDLGAATFVGHLQEFGDDFRMTVTYSPFGTEGMVLTPYGEYRLTTIKGQLWVIDTERSGLKASESDDSDAARPQQPAAAAAQAQAGSSSAAPTASAPASALSAAATPGNTRIDVLVLYTDGYVTARGSDAAAQSRIQYFIALSNQAYKDSNVPITLRLVGTRKLSGVGDTTSSPSELSRVTAGYGAYADVAGLRKTYGADLVSVMRPFSLKQGGMCGVAWVSGYGGTPVAWYGSYAFSVISDGIDGSYYCADHTFTHELGHNMGSMHDRATVKAQGGGTGAYPYAFGYGASGKFGTIMSYIQPRVGKFSNPDIRTCNGNSACGVALSDAANSANNALSLSNTRGSIAAFAAEVAALPVAVSGVVSAGGKPLAGIRIAPSAAGATCTASAANGSYSCVMPKGWMGSLTPSSTGFIFAPAAIPLSGVTTSLARQNFAAKAIPAPKIKPGKK